MSDMTKELKTMGAMALLVGGSVFAGITWANTGVNEPRPLFAAGLFVLAGLWLSWNFFVHGGENESGDESSITNGKRTNIMLSRREVSECYYRLFEYHRRMNEQSAINSLRGAHGIFVRSNSPQDTASKRSVRGTKA